MDSIGEAGDQFSPATYAIQVRGAVDPRWSGRLGGMRITSIRPDGAATTVLTGRLPDQAALLGVLNALYDLGFPLLAVTRLGPRGAV